tara:strand:+ start:1121 stop:1912 length:792 start_codon:yes stop_codon:yes gene_type:complete
MPSIRTSDEIEISYEISGESSKPTLMFSHSLGATRSMWGKQIEGFSRDFRILRYDTRGHGQSGSPQGPYTLKRLGQDAVELLDNLNIRSVHFCGLSLGGMTGLELGIQAPERLKSLAICCTSAHLPPKEMWDERIKRVTELGLSSITETVLRRWFTPSYLEKEWKDIEAVKSQLLSTPRRGYAGCSAAIRDMDFRAKLNNIDKPCLVVAGRDDQATPPKHGKLIAAGIVGSRYAVITDAAHLANIEQGDSFNSIVSSFLFQNI